VRQHRARQHGVAFAQQHPCAVTAFVIGQRAAGQRRFSPAGVRCTDAPAVIWRVSA